MTEAVMAQRPMVDPDTMNGATRGALVAYVQAIGDDEMLIGHRDAEWTGLGPILEEDIAFSSMAQDELGHALVWYRLIGVLGGPDPDSIGFRRDAPEWRHARLAELPRGDYAFSLVRQYLYDVAEAVRYDALTRSPWPPMAEAARKLRQEEKYHLIHGRTFLQRLGQATAESRARVQTALDEAFPYALGLWEPPVGEALLVAQGIVAPSGDLAGAWLAVLAPFLGQSGLAIAVAHGETGWQATVPPVLGGRLGVHGPDLAALLSAMQAMYRSDPDAAW